MSEFFLTKMGMRFYEATMPGLVRQLDRLNSNIEKLLAAKLVPLPEPTGAVPKSVTEMNNEQVKEFVAKWERNDLQFPRLLAEIRASRLTSEQYMDLKRSMGLEPDQIDEIFKRAEAEWEKIKQST